MSNVQINDQPEFNELFLTDEQVSSGQYPLNEVYQVRCGDQVYGPIWQQDIKEFLHSISSFVEETSLKSMDSEEWESLFDHPAFQRRKPQLISTQTLDTEETTYYLLIEGQKHGPYNSFEISSMLDSNEVLVTDEVSIDNGGSWGQLFNIEEFDRRNLKSNEELPGLPEDQIFQSSTLKTTQRIHASNDEETNLIAGLAYIGNLKIGKAKAKATEEKSHTETSSELPFEEFEQEETSRSYLWPILFVMSLVGITIVIATWSSNKPKTQTMKTKTSKTVRAKRIEPIKLKPISKTRAKTPSNFNSNTRINSRPTSFKRSKAFRQAGKRKKLSENALMKKDNADFYYDDASDPVELDPIRSTLSKETIDPEFGDEYDEEGERSPASEEIFDQEVEF
ncbi:hypothetical protein A9Q84_15865 [Halobacteriovorax marinus]|uniref:GYF domain-containing protein n=1 Tax=Halobacteriovorax marinus TaxID=97084 RepID=A0A1Y5F4B6_9BACT|nr:hypothetical protein A9Q84_15865 [Halobacteriovorax marinus]